MKTLKTNFIKNCDKSGNHRFLQLRKDGNVAMYRRETSLGRLVGYEVFTFKTIEAGTPMQGGGTVEETYESYPGGKAFGRSAWFFGGINAEVHAVKRYTELVTGNIPVVETEEVETEETEIVNVIKVSNTDIKKGLKWPVEPFTQKQLASFNGFENYKVVYSDLQKGLVKGIIKIVGEKESTRGKPAKLFEVVSV